MTTISFEGLLKDNNKKINSLFSFNKKLLAEKNLQKQFAHSFQIAKYFKFKSTSEDKLSTGSAAQNSLGSADELSVKQPVVHQGWLKYLEITEDALDVPVCFIKNNMYFLQMSENPGMNTLAADDLGYISIPNEDTFYFELTENQLTIYKARTPRYKKMEQELNLSDLIPQVMVNPCKGGIEDVGNFAEGYCFMLKFIKFSRHFIWELCSKSIYEKDRWMQKLIQMRSKIDLLLAKSLPVPVPLPLPVAAPVIVGPSIFDVPPPPPLLAAPVVRLSPHVLPPVVTGAPIGGTIISPSGAVIPPTLLPPPGFPGAVISPPGAVIAPTPLYPGTFFSPSGAVIAPTPIPAPGYPGYVIVGDWGPCSKPCGEGLQFRPLDCMDEYICKGKKLEQRLCNIQACKEDVEKHLEQLKMVSEGHWESLGTWSTCSRPCGGGIQSVERRCVGGACVGEAILTQPCNTFVCGDPKKMIISVSEMFNKNVYDECKMLEGNLMVVINNQKVLSHVAVNMQSIEIYSESNPGAPLTFPLTQITEVRPSISNPGCFKMMQDNGNVIALCPQLPESSPCETWIKRIKEFKYNCSNKLLTKFQNEIARSLDPNASHNQLGIMQQKVLEDQKLHSTIREKVLENQFEEFKRQARELMEKEEAYEMKLEQEEKDRIEMENKRLHESVALESTTAQKLLTDVRLMIDSESKYDLKERAIKREMKTIMSDIQEKINKKRELLLTKLQRMRTHYELEQKRAAQQLLDMKKNIGKQFSEMTKRGNPQQCFTKNISLIEVYCSANFKSPQLQIECKNLSQFCYMCCDSEIGPVNKEYLDCCLNKCDDIANGACINFNETYHILTQHVAYIK